LQNLRDHAKKWENLSEKIVMNAFTQTGWAREPIKGIPDAAMTARTACVRRWLSRLEIAAVCLALSFSLIVAYGRDVVSFEDVAKILFWASLLGLALRRARRPGDPA
jgi:hypothetical protein